MRLLLKSPSKVDMEAVKKIELLRQKVYNNVKSLPMDAISDSEYSASEDDSPEGTEESEESVSDSAITVRTKKKSERTTVPQKTTEKKPVACERRVQSTALVRSSDSFYYYCDRHPGKPSLFGPTHADAYKRRQGGLLNCQRKYPTGVCGKTIRRTQDFDFVQKLLNDMQG